MGHAFGVAAMIGATFLGARAQTPSSGILVDPMVRSAAFEFRLDKLAPTLYSKADYGPWMESGRRAMLQWRPAGESRWRTAQDFVRVQADRVTAKPTPDPRMATMLFGLEDGKTYEYRISFVGDGYPKGPITGSFTTLTVNPPQGRGEIVPIVVSPKTTSEEIMKIIKANITGQPEKDGGKIFEIRSAAGPGVRTVVHSSIASIYGRGDWVWSGTSKAWVTLRMAKGHNVIFDGSDPAYDVINAGMWQPVTDKELALSPGDGVYVSKTSVPVPSTVFYERTESMPGYRLLDLSEGARWVDNWNSTGSTGVIASKPGQILSASRSEGDARIFLQTDRNCHMSPGQQVRVSGTSNPAWNTVLTVTNTARDEKNGVYQVVVKSPDGATPKTATGGRLEPLSPTSMFKQRADANGECYAWVPDAPGAKTGRLYIHLLNGRDPNTVRVKIPVVASCLDVRSAHFVCVDGLNFQYFGSYDVAGFGGIGIIDVSDLVVKNNVLTGLTTYIGSRTSYNSAKARVVVAGNQMRERGLGADPAGGPTPDWGWIKGSKQEVTAIAFLGRAVSILDNHVEGSFNGFGWIGQYSDNLDGNQSMYPEGVEVDGNTFVGIGDDAVEPEQWIVNFTVTNNTFRQCYKGVSMAPIIGGPLYIMRNRWVGRGEYTASSDWQSFLKMGNDDPGDTGYKLVANNTVVNENASSSGDPLPGLMDSGAVYNHFYYNNYVASDGFSVAFGYGSLGYPHMFDYNRYLQGRPNDSWKGSAAVFAYARRSSRQGESLNTGSDTRAFATFHDWQIGKPKFGSSMPGYDGTVHDAPVTGRTEGGELVTWQHDPHGSYQVGTHELIDPVAGDFRPRPDAPVGGAGMRLANITYDCGPGWAQYEEAGNPTIGALPGGRQVKPGNRMPILSVPASLIAAAKRRVDIAASYTDPDGDAVSLIAVVRDAGGAVIPADVKDTGSGVATITFLPPSEGIYVATVDASDTDGAKARASCKISVGPEMPEGQDVLVQTSTSRKEARPGEAVTYTIYCSNPTSTFLKGAQLSLPVPSGMDFFPASATLDGAPATASVSKGVFQMSLGEIPAGVRRVVTVTAIIQ